MSQDYFSELEKIANEVAADIPEEPMTEDPVPAISPEEVEAAQAANAEEADPAAAEEQLPPSPEDEAALQESMEQAEADLQAAQEQLANASQAFQEFEKTAGQALADSLPAMGAFAKLIDYSTNPQNDPQLHKVAQERLQTALMSEDLFIETLQKTASELFESEENLNALYSDEGMKYIEEQLASFEDDEELSKIALEGGNIVGKVVDTIKDYGYATKNFFKLKDELNAANSALEEATNAAAAKHQEALAFAANGMKDKANQAAREHIMMGQDLVNLSNDVSDIQDARRKGAQVYGAGGALAAGGGLYGGKKIYDSLHPEEDVTDQDYFEGGNNKMASQIVHDFLKIAGAASLIDIANNPAYDEGIRKEAAEQFNYISRLGRREMDDSFVKVATQLYTEDEMHEIVAGSHTEELFDKIAFFLAANEATADELEKVAGADGVAAKGVAGALTDAAENIEKHVKEEKEKSETQANGRRNVVDPGDTDAYNVINNPGKYNVDKTAMLEQAVLQKQAAIHAYQEAEKFLGQFS